MVNSAREFNAEFTIHDSRSDPSQSRPQAQQKTPEPDGGWKPSVPIGSADKAAEPVEVAHRRDRADASDDEVGWKDEALGPHGRRAEHDDEDNRCCDCPADTLGAGGIEELGRPLL